MARGLLFFPVTMNHPPPYYWLDEGEEAQYLTFDPHQENVLYNNFLQERSDDIKSNHVKIYILNTAKHS